MSSQLAPQYPQDDSLKLSAGARQLLLAAERLIAERGLAALSTRMIAREAGQKNNSALQYHLIFLLRLTEIR